MRLQLSHGHNHRGAKGRAKGATKTKSKGCHQNQELLHSCPQKLLQPCPKDRAFLVPNRNLPFRNHLSKVLFYDPTNPLLPHAQPRA